MRTDESITSSEHGEGQEVGASVEQTGDAGAVVEESHTNAGENHSSSEIPAGNDSTPAGEVVPDIPATVDSGPAASTYHPLAEHASEEHPSGEPAGGEISTVAAQDALSREEAQPLSDESTTGQASESGQANESSQATESGQASESGQANESGQADESTQSVESSYGAVSGEDGDGGHEGPALEAHTAQDMQELFEQLLRAMGVRGSVRVREESSDQVTLDIVNCPDASLVIGRHGQTVDDLQFLGSLILNSRSRDRKRFMLNVENYRERREEILRNSAIDLARQVAQFGQEAVLDPLPPHERRIVHLALMDIPDIYTYSEGVEPDRRLVISPRNLQGAQANGGAELENGGEAHPKPESEADSTSEHQQEEGENAPEVHEQEAASVTGDHAPVDNPAFGEGESGSGNEIYRDVTEVGDSSLSSGPRETGEAIQAPPEVELPETTAGGGDGHTGADVGEQ